MIEYSYSSALLDACVLYPAPIRDLLLHISDTGLFKPKWSNQIHEEWTRNLLLNRPDLKPSQLKKTVSAMNQGFPMAQVHSYQGLIRLLNLPDPDDRHILAAAIQSQVNFIINFNLKDFPADILDTFSLQALHPDEFISQLINENEELVSTAFFQQLSYLRNPPLTAVELLENFKRIGLVKVSDKLKEINN